MFFEDSQLNRETLRMKVDGVLDRKLMPDQYDYFVMSGGWARTSRYTAGHIADNGILDGEYIEDDSIYEFYVNKHSVEQMRDDIARIKSNAGMQKFLDENSEINALMQEGTPNALSKLQQMSANYATESDEHKYICDAVNICDRLNKIPMLDFKCNEINNYIDWNKASKYDYEMAAQAACRNIHSNNPFDEALECEAMSMLTIESMRKNSIPIPDEAFDLRKRQDWLLQVAGDNNLKQYIPDSDKINAHVYMTKQAIFNTKPRQNPLDADAFHRYISSRMSDIHNDIVNLGLDHSESTPGIVKAEADIMRARQLQDRKQFHNKHVEFFIENKILYNDHMRKANANLDIAKQYSEKNSAYADVIANDNELKSMFEKIAQTGDIKSIDRDAFNNWYRECCRAYKKSYCKDNNITDVDDYAEVIFPPEHVVRASNVSDTTKMLASKHSLGETINKVFAYQSQAESIHKLCVENSEHINWNNIDRKLYARALNATFSDSSVQSYNNTSVAFISKLTDQIRDLSPNSDERSAYKQALAAREAIIESRLDPTNTDEFLKGMQQIAIDTHSEFDKKLSKSVSKQSQVKNSDTVSTQFDDLKQNNKSDPENRIDDCNFT